MERGFQGLARNGLRIDTFDHARPFSGGYSPDRGSACGVDGHPPVARHQALKQPLPTGPQSLWSRHRMPPRHQTGDRSQLEGIYGRSYRLTNTRGKTAAPPDVRPSSKQYNVCECLSINGRFWFLARPERVLPLCGTSRLIYFRPVGVNRKNSRLFRGLKTSENAARGQKMPFMTRYDITAPP